MLVRCFFDGLGSDAPSFRWPFFSEKILYDYFPFFNVGLLRLLFWCAAVLTCSTDCRCHSCIFVCCINMFHFLTYNMLVQICWFRYVGSDMLVVMVSCATFWDSIFFLHCNKVIEQALSVLSCFYASCISLICTITTLFLTWVRLHCFFGVLPFRLF